MEDLDDDCDVSLPVLENTEGGLVASGWDDDSDWRPVVNSEVDPRSDSAEGAWSEFGGVGGRTFNDTDEPCGLS